MRGLWLVAWLAACTPPVSAPAPVKAPAATEIAVPAPIAGPVQALVGDGRWLVVSTGGSSMYWVDLQARTAIAVSGEPQLAGTTPVLLSFGAGPDRTVTWPRGAITLASKAELPAAAVRLDAAVPVVTVDYDATRVYAAGWRVDGTPAWHTELGDTRGTEVRSVAHLGDLVVFQTVGAWGPEYSPAEHFPPGTTVALDATTGAVRWRHDLVGFAAYPVAEAVAAHGDEIAFVYDSPRNEIHVHSRADGRELRAITLDREAANGAQGVGFDGDTLWIFEHYAARKDGGSDMYPFRHGPGPDRPASCFYMAYDTRHDRKTPLRVNATSAIAAQLDPCVVVGMVGLADGRVQVVTEAAQGAALTVTTYPRAP